MLFSAVLLAPFGAAANHGNLSLLQEKKHSELAGHRVLLAEDVGLNAEIMLDLLSMGEMEADHTENGKNAVQMFGKSAAGTYTAILMDVRKTEMDGLTAATAIGVAVGDAFSEQTDERSFRTLMKLAVVRLYGQKKRLHELERAAVQVPPRIDTGAAVRLMSCLSGETQISEGPQRQIPAALFAKTLQIIAACDTISTTAV